ncbi:hypothetical protein AB0F77_04525 [Streptomyces sp. NPDC026672]|uniref:hypothetical protein n=1 Tax=unclassified Streptomyces TaxID=2593676 RepID=UPI0033D36653
MEHTVLALGAAAVAVAGCVWYLPALADLRAGADRPVSRRTRAAACLSGWATVPFVAVLLLCTESWWAPGAVAGLGVVLAVGLLTGAAVQRRREARETARQWAELRQVRAPVGGGRARTVVAVLLGAGLGTAVVVSVFEVMAGPEDGADWLATAVAPVAVVGLFLTLAVAHGRASRRSPVRRPRRVFRRLS